MKKSRLLLTILCAGLLTLSACNQGGGGITPEVKDPSLNFTEKTIDVDETFVLSVSDIPSGVIPTWSQTGTSVSYTLVDAQKADSATIKGLLAGESTISVAVGEKSLSCKVTVNGKTPAGPTSIALNKSSLSLFVGDTETLTTDYEGEERLAWASSDSTVASVSNGVVTAVAEGNANITVSFVNYPDVKATCAVEVNPIPEDYFIQEPTEILVKTTFNDTYGQILIDAANDLMKKEPKLTVNYEKYSGSYDALKDDIINGIPAGNYPDVTVAYPDSVAEFIEAGVHLNANKYINDEDYGLTEEELEDFYQVYLDEGRNYTVKGTYSLPLAKSTEAMYYDADKIIGLNLASINPAINDGNPINKEYIDNLTWEELFDVFCPALLAYRETLPTPSEKKAFLDTTSYSDWAVVGYDSDDNLFITLAEQYGYGYTSMDVATGSGHIDFINDGMKGLMKTFNAAYKNKYITTKGIIGTNVNYRSTVDAMLFSIGSTGGVNYQFSSANPKKIGVAPIPHAEGKELKMIQQGPSYVMLNHKDSNKSLASWLFYKEFIKLQRQIAWCTTTGYSPIMQSVSESDDFLVFCDETRFEDKTSDHLKALNAQYVSEYVDVLFASPVFKGSATARSEVGGLATKAIGAASLTDDELNKLFQDAYEHTIMKM